MFYKPEHDTVKS